MIRHEEFGNRFGDVDLAIGFWPVIKGAETILQRTGRFIKNLEPGVCALTNLSIRWILGKPRRRRIDPLFRADRLMFRLDLQIDEERGNREQNRQADDEETSHGSTSNIL